MESQLTLVERYTYGDKGSIKEFYGNAEGKTDAEKLRNELLVESPNRQRAMINLAERQIKTQEVAAREIVASNIEGAKMVATQIDQQTQEMRLEIREQTSQLQSTFESVGANISGSISSAADQISSSIEALGNKLSMELSEINWQIVQQNQKLDKILSVLSENRSNEARQLVAQGVRLYVNEQYEKAEERFLRALDFDMTDYQVLMNLAYIELHKENAEGAMAYFQDALSLPASLDGHSKARTLWAIARLYYVNREYKNALAYAEKALEVESQIPKYSHKIHAFFNVASYYDPDQETKNYLERASIEIECRDPKHIFTNGMYAALAEDKNRALSRIRTAIETDSSLFILAAIDPDLELIRQDVLALLGQMSIEKFRKAVSLVEEFQSSINHLKTYKGNELCPNFIPTVQNILDDSKMILKQESYSRSLQCIANLAHLKYLCEAGNKVLPAIGNHTNKLDKLMQEKIAIEQKNKAQEFKIAKAKLLLDMAKIFLPIVYVIAIILFIRWGLIQENFWMLFLGSPLFGVIMLFPFAFIYDQFVKYLAKQNSKKSNLSSQEYEIKRDIDSYQSKMENLSKKLTELITPKNQPSNDFFDNVPEKLIHYFYQKKTNEFDSSISSYLK